MTKPPDFQTGRFEKPFRFVQIAAASTGHVYALDESGVVWYYQYVDQAAWYPLSTLRVDRND